MIREALFFGAIPTLIAYAKDRQQAASRGTVLVYHGFTSCKEDNLRELQKLAEAGFLGVAVDAVGHGARIYPDFEDRLGLKPEKEFYALVAESAREVPWLVEQLQKRGLIHQGKLGLLGTSMGGHIAYGASLFESRIVAATILLGSPRWPFDFSPHLHLEKFYPLALLTETAECDEVVPPQAAIDLHQRLQPFYAAAPERLKHVTLAGEKHALSEDAWAQAIDGFVAWFERFLPP